MANYSEYLEFDGKEDEASSFAERRNFKFHLFGVYYKAQEKIAEYSRFTRVVDPENTDVRRFSVLHNRYDAHRNQVRLVHIATFTTQRGMNRLMKRLSADLDKRILTGEAKKYEHIQGSIDAPQWGRNSNLNFLAENKVRRRR